MNDFREKLNSNKIVRGVWSIISSPTVNEIVALAGYEFQILDMEHGTHDISTLENSIRSCELNGCAALVRVPEANAGMVQKILDMGAVGIIVPQIKSYEEASVAVRVAHYYPVGCRGYNPFTRGNSYHFSENKKEIKPVCGVIIENSSAYADIDKILTLKDLDLVYLGAYDMSVELGCPGDMENLELVEFIETGIRKIKAAGKIAGVMVNSANAEKFVSLGAHFLVLGVDTYLIGHSLKKINDSFLSIGNKK